MQRAVLDTNVLVSSMISRKGAPFQLIEAWHESRFVLITSDIIIEEVQRVLSRPHLKDTFSITEDRILRLVETLKKDAICVIGNADVRGAIPDDPSDEKFLAAALNGKSKIIISGDQHLLDLKTYQDIVILTPRQFLDSLDAE
jgi:putative PIN family toxin of toxin-antitoxin system